jgi:eukaryotic-like serine/threonine-protein kinase
MKITAFLSSKTFFANLVLAIVAGSLVWFLLMFGLKQYTRHGQKIIVPDVRTFALHELDARLGALDLKWTVIDSSEFVTTMPPGAVVNQYPEPGTAVKRYREIKITVNPMAPRKIQIPNLVEKTRRRAIYDLESKGFVVGRLSYVPYLGKDVVVEAQVGGMPVVPGEFYKKGTVVNLILGDGLSDERISVPFLLGLSAAEAQLRLAGSGLNMGAVIFDDEQDTLSARVYRQYPSPVGNATARQGTSVDIWLTNNPDKIPADSLSLYDSGGLPEGWDGLPGRDGAE